MGLHVVRVRGEAADVEDEAAVGQQGVGRHGHGGLAFVQGGEGRNGRVLQQAQEGPGLFGVHGLSS